MGGQKIDYVNFGGERKAMELTDKEQRRKDELFREYCPWVADNKAEPGTIDDHSRSMGFLLRFIIQLETKVNELEIKMDKKIIEENEFKNLKERFRKQEKNYNCEMEKKLLEPSTVEEKICEIYRQASDKIHFVESISEGTRSAYIKKEYFDSLADIILEILQFNIGPEKPE